MHIKIKSNLRDKDALKTCLRISFSFFLFLKEYFSQHFRVKVNIP